MNNKFIKVLIPRIVFIIAFIIIYPIHKDNKDVMMDKEVKSNTKYIPILTFHRLVPDDVKKEIYPDNQWVGSSKVFEEMIDYLYKNEYKTISTEEFYKWYNGEVDYDNKTIVITFDDGFYEDYYLAYPILKKYDYKATSFVVGSRIKDKTDKYDKYKTSFIGLDVINKVRKEYPNFEFQSHSYNMHYYTQGKKHRIKTMSYEQLQEDTKLNEPFKFTTMAYPYGDFNQNIQEVLENNNYLVAFRFGPSDYATRDSDRYAIPRIKINGNADITTLKKWLDY